MIALLLLPFRLVLFALLTPLRVVRIPVKLFGYRGAFALGLGFGIGLVVAPRTGVETRQRLRQMYEEWAMGRDPLTWSGTPGAVEPSASVENF